ncbi:MAG: DUF2752 domain-containing protein [Lachnospiraceae bacterium]|nr:DUF2752 domain-containing protein [Lachnospiraceae bacterium]
MRHYWLSVLIAAAVIVLLNLLFGTVCPVRILFGLPCPGCGMTRALLSLLRLDFSTAVRLHPLSPAFFLLLLLFPVFRYRKRERFGVWVRICAVLLVLLLPVYVYRMLKVFPGEPPMDNSFGESLLYRILTIFK